MNIDRSFEAEFLTNASRLPAPPIAARRSHQPRSVWNSDSGDSRFVTAATLALFVGSCLMTTGLIAHAFIG